LSSKDKEQSPEGIKLVDIDNLFEESDVISLHCPLTESTRHIVNRQRIDKMQNNAILINTGRGPLVNDVELAEALNNKRILAYGADVITQEPPVEGNSLLNAKNAFFTPHIAWATEEARIRLINIAAQNVKAFIKGKPINTVN
jgi:glycerate dehydrogenase